MFLTQSKSTCSRVLLITTLFVIVTGRGMGSVSICEIHYNPAGVAADGEEMEFVELYNDEPLPFDISDYQLSGGVAFVFPRGTVIDARSAIVIARDPDGLEENAGVEGVLGPYFGRLDNSGDEIVLLDTGGGRVCRVRYNDRGRWPTAPDGGGPSLVLRGPLLDAGESESWGWSIVSGGTPGAVSFETVQPEIVINEVVRRKDGWIELFCPGREAVDLTGLGLRSSGSAATREFPADAAIAGRGFFSIAQADLPFDLDLEDVSVLLVASDGRIVDARQLGVAPQSGGEGRFPDGADRWQILDPVTRDGANQRAPTPPVVINEIHYHPHSERVEEEFVELLNTGDATIDLEGFTFTSGIDFVFAEATALGPGELLVVAKDPPTLEALHGIEGVFGPYTGVLANSGEMVRLVDARGQTVDEVRYFDDGAWPRWPDGDGPSLELVDPRQDNRVGAAWRESDHAASSEWNQYEYTARQVAGDSELHLFLMGAGEVLVDDIEIVPEDGGQNSLPDGDFNGENPTRSWRIEGTHLESRVDPTGGPDGSACLHIIASKRGDSRVNRIERQTSPSLVSGRQYTVRFMARWLRGADGIMTRSFNHGIARVTRIAVPGGGGTPGAANSRLAANVGPVVSEVEQSPALPAAGDAVTVTCRVSDADGVAEVSLLWRLDGEAEFRTVAMLDDGESPDAVANDGLFAARFEAEARARQVGEFRVFARDEVGGERYEPRGESEPTYIYQYDDGVRPHDVPAYRVVLRQREHTELRTRSPLSNHALPASLIVGRDRIHHLAGLRFRGSPYLRRNVVTGGRKGFRVNLPDSHLLRGSSRITLDEQQADATRQVDRLVRHMLQRSGGMAYGERRHVHVIYRGVSAATYEDVLTVDGRYLERAFGAEGADGQVYKIDAHYEIADNGQFGFPAFTSWRHTDDKEALRFVYKKRSHEKEDDFGELIELLDLMDTRRTSNEDFDARVAELIDIDQWVRGIAVYRACEDWDTIGGWTGKNVYLYHHPDGRWRFIPWDHDVSFGAAALNAEHNPRAYIFTPHYAEIRRFLMRPAFQRKFLAEIERLLDEDYDRAVVDPVLDATHAMLARASGAGSPARIKSFLGTRRSYLGSQIRGADALTIETNDGAPMVVVDPVLTLRGEAPLAADQLVVDGIADEQSPAVRWIDSDTWEIDVTLRPGSGTVSVVGFDRRGEIVGTASIEVTFDAPFVPFVRGDTNGDGEVNISDAVVTLNHLFRGGAMRCSDAGDADDSGALNLTDAVYTLGYLFRGGPPPPPPFPAAGDDPSADDLGCE